MSKCSVRTCDSAPAGSSPRTSKPLCSGHLREDIQAVARQRHQLREKLQPLLQQLEDCRLEQQALTAEMLAAEEAFAAVQESVQKWKAEVTQRLQARHETISRSVQDCALMQEYSEVEEDSEDWQRVFEDTSHMEVMAICYERECGAEIEKRKAVSDAKRRHVRRVGDVSGGVRDLQFAIDTHMTSVAALCNEQECSASPLPAARAADRILTNVGRVAYLAACSNTVGFAGNAEGRVEKADASGADGQQQQRLPQPCLFASFNQADAKKHLLLLSPDGKVQLRCESADIDWTKAIVALHCDSRRQLLFISQIDAVTVTDLSCTVVRVINAASLERSGLKLNGLDGNADKLFALDIDSKQILGIGKDSSEVEFVIDAEPILQFGQSVVMSRFVCCHEDKLLVGDTVSGAVHTVCCVTKQLVGTFPNGRSNCSGKKLQSPAAAAVSSRGLVFVSDIAGHSIEVFLSDGRVAQTLGQRASPGNAAGQLNSPCGLCVLPAGDGAQELVLADMNNSRLQVYTLL